MTPAARIAAAIEVLDRYLAGMPGEQALTRWARGARYAGSGDRAAVRDHVFEALRRLRSDAALGGARTGRGLMLGALRRIGGDVDRIFTGQTHAAAALSKQERLGGRAPKPGAEQLDIPDWLWPRFADMPGAARALQSRAQVFLRVNTLKSDRHHAIAALARDGVTGATHEMADTALVALEGARRIRGSQAFRDGLVELQDAASQAVVQALPLCDGMRVLDYCSGGGGKALAMAGRAKIDLFAYDIAPQRMRDLPVRAERAGVELRRLSAADLARTGPYDLVLCDAPCSGSGAWRRSPEGKWALTPARLAELGQMQGEILRNAKGLVAPGGILAYATCSVFAAENGDRINGFLAGHPGWKRLWQQSWPVQLGADGFYSAHLTRE